MLAEKGQLRREIRNPLPKIFTCRDVNAPVRSREAGATKVFLAAKKLA
jgi:hypothetical protein